MGGPSCGGGLAPASRVTSLSRSREKEGRREAWSGVIRLSSTRRAEANCGWPPAGTATPCGAGRGVGRAQVGQDATCVGRVVSTGVLPTRRGLRVFRAVLRDASGVLECAWPGQPFLERQIKAGQLLLVTGPVRYYHGRQLVPREFIVLSEEGEEPDRGLVLPVYPATEGLTHRQIRGLLHQ